MKLNVMDFTAMVLVIVGGLNWGLVSLFDFDLVASLFGEMTFLSRVVYGFVGLSAVYMIATIAKLSQSATHHEATKNV